MNVPSTILVFSLFTCAFAFPTREFYFSARATVACEKPVNAVVKVFLMEEDSPDDDDEIAMKTIHLTPKDDRVYVEFNVTAIDFYFDVEAEIYLAFWHNCDGVWRWYCTFTRSVRDDRVRNFGYLRIPYFFGRKCPIKASRDRPTPKDQAVSAAINATCANLTGPVNIQAILMENDGPFEDAVVKRHFTLSPEHRIVSLNIQDAHVTELPGDDHVELYWAFIHTCAGEIKASCTPTYSVRFLETFNFEHLLHIDDDLLECNYPPIYYAQHVPLNRE